MGGDQCGGQRQGQAGRAGLGVACTQPVCPLSSCEDTPPSPYPLSEEQALGQTPVCVLTPASLPGAGLHVIR